jgi:phage gp29-like protein
MNWLKQLLSSGRELFTRRRAIRWDEEQAPVEIDTLGERDPLSFDDDLLAKHGYEIYDQMLTDAHVRACFNLKRLGILSVGWRLEPADDSPDARFVRDFVLYNLQTMAGGVFSLLWRTLDALAKGFAVLEKLYEWRTTPPYAGFWTLKGFKAKNPALFTFEVDAFRNVRALLLNAPDGRRLALPRDKFILYAYNARYESPAGESDLRAAYPHWRSKQRILQMWDLFLAKYAAPTLIGVYRRGLPPSQQEELLRALDRLQQETAMVVPEEVEVRALELKQSGADSFAEAITYHNAEIAKSLLGETLTTDEGQRVGSLALGQVHLKVLQTQLRALRADLAERVMQDQVIRPLLHLNFGSAPEPRFLWEED